MLDALARCEDVDIVVTMGTLLGKGFFLDNLLNTALRPVYYLARLRTARLVPFGLAVRRGFFKSWKGRGERNPEGSGGIDPSEMSKWADSALVGRMRKLMAEEGKPIIAVSVNEEESTLPEAQGPSPLYRLVARAGNPCGRQDGVILAAPRFHPPVNPRARHEPVEPDSPSAKAVWAWPATAVCERYYSSLMNG